MTLQYDEFNKNILSSVPTGSALLDVGCGRGRFYEWACKHKYEYQGIDIDPEVVKQAILKYRSWPQFKPNIFHVMDGQEMPMFADKSVDTILLVEVIEHIENLPTLAKLLKECIRITRTNIMLTTPNCSDEAFLKKHGLIYNHYTHSVGEGFNFKMDSPHYHHLRFTKDLLSQFLRDNIGGNYEVVERKPIPITSQLQPDHILYDKLWAEIRV